MASRNQLTSVVIPTDFSEGSQFAVERALKLPLAPKAKLTLLHVLPDDVPGKLRKDALAEAERSLEKAAARAQQLLLQAGRQATVVQDVLEGRTSDVVIKRAHTVEADVIVMGRRGRRSLVQVLLGSNTARVVRESDVPVLVVKSPARDLYRRAVVAIETEPTGKAVLKTARPYVEDALSLTVLHAASVPFEDAIDLAQLPQLREEAADAATKRVEALVKGWGMPRADAVVKPGDARMLIIETVTEHNADLVVLGTRARKGLKRMLLGSVAEWVLSNAPCDVLVSR